MPSGRAFLISLKQSWIFKATPHNDCLNLYIIFPLGVNVPRGIFMEKFFNDVYVENLPKRCVQRDTKQDLMIFCRNLLTNREK